MATTYFGSKPVSDWTPNGSFESGHDFINQINKQQQDIDAKKGEYGAQQGTTNQAQQTYEDAYKGQNAYSDLYNQAQKSEGVDEAKAQYQKSLASVNATNSAMNNLPSSINAGSNVVLNASQRNAALGNQMQKYQNTLDYQTRQNAGDLSQYQTALASAQDLAKTNMSQEQTKVAQSMQNYQAQMNQLNELYNQVLNEKNIMRQIYGDMYDDEYNHMQQQLEIWAQNLNAETQRYAQDQETARNNAKIAAEKYAADAGLRLQKYMDQRNAEIAKAKNKPNYLDDINKVYAQYQSQLADLDRQTKDFGTYLNPFGSNGMFGSGFGTNSTATQAKNLRNKGFEDYLYQQNPYLQKMLRENYSDMLGMYGIGG